MVQRQGPYDHLALDSEMGSASETVRGNGSGAVSNMWFCWERSPRGWAPVVFHIEKPRASDSRVIMCEVPDNLAHGGEPMFGLLVERYPAPPAHNYSNDE